MMQIKQRVFNLTKNNFSDRVLSAERYIRRSEFVIVFKVSLFGTIYIYVCYYADKEWMSMSEKNTIT